MSLIHHGSVTDIKSSLKCNEDAYSIEYLYEQVALEFKNKDRISVTKMLVAAAQRKFKKLQGKELFDNYPKKEIGRYRYVRYPVEFDGKWEAVNVNLPTGYTRLISATRFDNIYDCSKACDWSNKYCGFSNAQVLEIVGESFNNYKED